MTENRSNRLIAAVACFAATLAIALPAEANYQVWQAWTLSDSAWNVDTLLKVDELTAQSFFAHWMNREGSSSLGMYIGIQEEADGYRQARFSVWDASEASTTSGDCQPFTGEGEGMSCTIPYAFVTGRWYKLRVWRLGAGSTGWWWGAWIIDTVTGVESYIGQILAPDFGNIDQSKTFTEKYGTLPPCGQNPYTKATFEAPSVNNGAGSFVHGTTFMDACAYGRITPVDDTVVLEQGTFQVLTCTLAATQDSWVRSNRANNNYGSSSNLYVRPESHNGKNIRRAFLQFEDFGTQQAPAGSCEETGAPIPANALIGNAWIKLYTPDIPSPDLWHSVHRVDAPWTENGITWNNQPAASTLVHISQVGPNNETNLRVTDGVRDVWAGQADNHGWRVSDVYESEGGGSELQVRYKSRDAGDPDQRPTLSIVYLLVY